MSALTERKSAASWTFDAAVSASGVLIGLLAVAALLIAHLDLHWLAALVLGPPVIALMSRFPLVLTRDAGGIEVGFDSAVLVFLATSYGGVGALAVCVTGVAATPAY